MRISIALSCEIHTLFLPNALPRIDEQFRRSPHKTVELPVEGNMHIAILQEEVVLVVSSVEYHTLHDAGFGDVAVDVVEERIGEVVGGESLERVGHE